MVAAALGIYDVERVLRAPWVGLPGEWPGLGLDFGIHFWTLLPSFLFLGVINSIQANGAAIALQRVSWRENRAVDFRQVQGALAGGGVTNLLAGIAGTVPNIINPGIASFTQITGGRFPHSGILRRRRRLSCWRLCQKRQDCSAPYRGLS